MDDGRSVTRIAESAQEMPGILPSIRGTASVWLSLGYARMGRWDESRRAMDASLRHLSTPAYSGPGPVSTIESSTADSLVTMRLAHAPILADSGAQAVQILEPRMGAIGGDSPRRLNTNRARLALGYANAADPDIACRLAMESLDVLDTFPSMWALSELRRSAHGRETSVRIQRHGPRAPADQRGRTWSIA